MIIYLPVAHGNGCSVILHTGSDTARLKTHNSRARARPLGVHRALYAKFRVGVWVRVNISKTNVSVKGWAMDGRGERDSPKEAQSNAEMLLALLSHSEELRKGNISHETHKIISIRSHVVLFMWHTWACWCDLHGVIYMLDIGVFRYKGL